MTHIADEIRITLEDIQKKRQVVRLVERRTAKRSWILHATCYCINRRTLACDYEQVPLHAEPFADREDCRFAAAPFRAELRTQKIYDRV